MSNDLPDTPLALSEDDVEIGLYTDDRGHPVGIHFAVDYATTAARRNPNNEEG